MEFFKRAKVLRLKCGHQSKYLLADEDEETVRQSSNKSSPNALWTLELVEGKSSVIRFRNKQTSKYLATTDVAFLTGMTGKKVAQRIRLDSTVEWEPVKEGQYIKVKSQAGTLLRANPRFPPWSNSVTHDEPGHWTASESMVLWIVDIVDLDYSSPGSPKLDSTTPPAVVKHTIDSPSCSSSLKSRPVPPPVVSEEFTLSDVPKKSASARKIQRMRTGLADELLGVNEQSNSGSDSPNERRNSGSEWRNSGSGRRNSGSDGGHERKNPGLHGSSELRNSGLDGASQRSNSVLDGADERRNSRSHGAHERRNSGSGCSTERRNSGSDRALNFPSVESMTGLAVNVAKLTFKELKDMEFRDVLSSGQLKRLETAINVLAGDAKASSGGNIPRDLANLQERLKAMKKDHERASRELVECTAFSSNRYEARSEQKRINAKVRELEAVGFKLNNSLTAAKAKREELLKQLEEIDNSIKIAENSLADYEMEVQEVVSRIEHKSKALKVMEREQKSWRLKKNEADRTLERIEEDWIEVKNILAAFC